MQMEKYLWGRDIKTSFLLPFPHILVFSFSLPGEHAQEPQPGEGFNWDSSMNNSGQHPAQYPSRYNELNVFTRFG